MTTRPPTQAGQYHQRLKNEIDREIRFADATMSLFVRMQRAFEADIAQHGELTDDEKAILRSHLKSMRGAVDGHRERADNARESLDRISTSRHNSKLAVGITYPNQQISGRIEKTMPPDDPGFAALARAAQAEMEDPLWLEDLSR